MWRRSRSKSNGGMNVFTIFPRRCGVIYYYGMIAEAAINGIDTRTKLIPSGWMLTLVVGVTTRNPVLSLIGAIFLVINLLQLKQLKDGIKYIKSSELVQRCETYIQELDTRAHEITTTSRLEITEEQLELYNTSYDFTKLDMWFEKGLDESNVKYALSKLETLKSEIELGKEKVEQYSLLLDVGDKDYLCAQYMLKLFNTLPNLSKIEIVNVTVMLLYGGEYIKHDELHVTEIEIKEHKMRSERMRELRDKTRGPLSEII